ncbi:Oligopeptide transport ATP-binding protein OppF [Caenispirillum salinarum AK4]|uniref:Oligopeptide transport ATP-binding protein OppF n=1 Tax=Caenispirillum salinarum AK4 TaxID=1238182 RepID=K9H454_9PROT|nr:ABC transporter ATP-binding protein [Caenispirillum salinarum]EKV31859.1 Oligopeptide transport ATP-binding protein OppF [Caenispirillum salinarum AK4]
MSTLLEVEHLKVRFRSMGALRALMRRVKDPYIDAVCDVSFRIGRGETLGLVGESGSGKSTIARALMGLIPSHGGSMRFDGTELRGLSQRAYKPVRRDMAMMFQDPVGSLSPRLTVRSLITEPFRIHGVRDRDMDAETRRLLEMVGLPAGFAQRFPHQLSGGQARRVGVARALALDPRLVIADEPTAGLDVSIQGEVMNLLAELQDRLGIGMVVITHNLNVVRHISDQMAVMYLGRFVEQGPTEEVFHRPRHPYTEVLLSANPEPDPDAKLHRVEARGDIPSLAHRPTGCEFHTRCPRARDYCREVAPALSSAAPDHTYTCHFPLEADAKERRLEA